MGGASSHGSRWSWGMNLQPKVKVTVAKTASAGVQECGVSFPRGGLAIQTSTGISRRLWGLGITGCRPPPSPFLLLQQTHPIISLYMGLMLRLVHTSASSVPCGAPTSPENALSAKVCSSKDLDHSNRVSVKTLPYFQVREPCFMKRKAIPISSSPLVSN